MPFVKTSEPVDEKVVKWENYIFQKGFVLTAVGRTPHSSTSDNSRTYGKLNNSWNPFAPKYISSIHLNSDTNICEYCNILLHDVFQMVAYYEQLFEIAPMQVIEKSWINKGNDYRDKK